MKTNGVLLARERVPEEVVRDWCHNVNDRGEIASMAREVLMLRGECARLKALLDAASVDTTNSHNVKHLQKIVDRNGNSDLSFVASMLILLIGVNENRARSKE